MNLQELYQSRLAEGGRAGECRTLLEQTHWFTVNAVFDPKTGMALPQALSVFLARVAATPVASGTLQDRLWRITDHARSSVERLLRAPSESPRRQHALLPVHAVRALDASSFIKLSNRPGRNIREKLAGKPYLQAVRRFQSVDLPENQLLRAFVTRLAELLALRRDCLGEDADELLSTIHSWLRSGEGQAISRWQNLVPNNTLLSHRDYRRVWDAWRWLQTIDEDVDRDFSQLSIREETVLRWKEMGARYADGTHLFAEMPLLFDYDKFDICPWLGAPAFRTASKPVSRHADTIVPCDGPVCIDLATLRPHYADTTVFPKPLSETYLWQQWKSDDETFEAGLFTADAACCHDQVTSISAPDLFFSTHNTLEHLDRAARAFARRLRERFRHDTLLWLVPDFLNDFELEITRRNLNARFPNASPVPRSVAAVFEWLDTGATVSDGISVVTIDTVGGVTCAIKLIARYDKALHTVLPETLGFYWERCPHVIVSRNDAEGQDRDTLPGHGMVYLDKGGQWHESFQVKRVHPPEVNALRRDPRIGNFSHVINVPEHPVSGGIRLHTLQQKAGDIPLWRDNIPELSIKVMQDGRYQRFHLVSRGTTVKPIRGQSVRIPVQKRFTLPAGKPYYEFPLFQGEDANELGFSARLDSSAFPLASDTICKLALTFEYGASEPYVLTFFPLDITLTPIRASWRRTVYGVITNAPSPGYPAPVDWASISADKLLDSMLSAVKTLDQLMYIRHSERITGEIQTLWKQDSRGKYFAFASSGQCKENIFIHENNFIDGCHYKDYSPGDCLSFELKETNRGRYAGQYVAEEGCITTDQLRVFEKDDVNNISRMIYSNLYARFIQIWGDGRSIADKDCPPHFAREMRDIISYIDDLAYRVDAPQHIKDRLIFLLACLHKDTTHDTAEYITRISHSGSVRNARAVGFALGDLSQVWQKKIFRTLMYRPTSSTVRVFSYSVWREQHFIDRFSATELRALLVQITTMLANVRSISPEEYEGRDKLKKREWDRNIAEPLELLLGLLRTRSSENNDSLMILQPHQEITRTLAIQLERVTDIVLNSRAPLFSRVQIDVKKAADERTPNLLYALRLYLTGDDGANAIWINSVSDKDIH